MPLVLARAKARWKLLFYEAEQRLRCLTPLVVTTIGEVPRMVVFPGGIPYRRAARLRTPPRDGSAEKSDRGNCHYGTSRCNS
jgi:hypothetical protein